MRDEFVSGIVNNKPAFIVETGDGRLPPLDSTERDEWEPNGRRYVEPDAIKGFFDLVDSAYEAVEEVDDFTIYKLADNT